MTPLEIIKAFVESLITPEEFEIHLHNNAVLSSVLQESFSLPSYVEETDLYSFAIGQDYSTIESTFNTQVLLSSFLQSRAVEHERSKKYEDLFNLLLKVQPKWLNLPSVYLSSLLDIAPSQSTKELHAWLKEKIKNEFRYLKTPPKWLQAPAWPIVNGKPLVFVGQLDVSDLGHDTSQAYLFFNPTSDSFYTIKQSC